MISIDDHPLRPPALQLPNGALSKYGSERAQITKRFT